MELYAEVNHRRAVRAARRAERRALEERIERRLAPVVKVVKMALLCAIVYVFLFMGCLWAAA